MTFLGLMKSQYLVENGVTKHTLLLVMFWMG